VEDGSEQFEGNITDLIMHGTKIVKRKIS